MSIRNFIEKSFTFSAAHQLLKVDPDHKCARLHGHTYHVKIILSCAALDGGMVLDFGHVKTLIHGMFDHQNLNEVFKQNGIEGETTAEILCHVCFDLLQGTVVMETNRGRERSDWVRIDEVHIQEGEGGKAWLKISD